MSNRPNSDRGTRSLMRSKGGTYMVSIPIEIIQKLKWREKQKVTVSASDGGVLIKDWKK